MPLRTISILIRLAGLFYVIGYDALDAIDAWNEWESLYGSPPDPEPHPTRMCFVVFGLAEYTPFIIAAAFWLFHRDIVAAWRTGRQRHVAAA